MPATNAPSASDTPKKCEDASAVPTATVSATRTNSSRDRVWTTRPRIQGTTRAPANIISATNRTARPIAMPAVAQGPEVDGPASTGSSTRMATISRSSTTSQPTATLPAGLSSQPWSISARNCTTVLATASAMPRMAAPAGGMPHQRATP